METQLFGKGGILLNRKLFVFCFFLFIIFLFNCKEEKEVNSEDTHEIEYLNKNEIKGKYHFLDSISNFRNFPSEKIKYKKLNENLSSIEIKDKENQIFSKGLIITNTEKKYLWWDIQYQDIVFKIEYITEYEKINQQKVYKANNKLDTVQSFYFTTERKGSDLIINYFEHKYTDDDSIYIDYRINGKSFETINGLAPY